MLYPIRHPFRGRGRSILGPPFYQKPQKDYRIIDHIYLRSMGFGFSGAAVVQLAGDLLEEATHGVENGQPEIVAVLNRFGSSWKLNLFNLFFQLPVIHKGVFPFRYKLCFQLFRELHHCRTHRIAVAGKKFRPAGRIGKYMQKGIDWKV